MRKSVYIPLLALAAFIVSMVSCNKNDPYFLILPPPQVHFVGAKIQSYAVRSAGVAPYVITVGTTDVAKVDRTATYTVVSPTGAVNGTQYTLSPAASVTIPAGGTRADITIQGKFSGYPVGRIDTLIFALATPSIEPAKFSDTIKLAMGDICTEGSGVVLTSLQGSYAHTNDLNPAYGPYITTIPSTSSTTSTSGTITVTNFWDYGFSPLVFKISYASAAAMTVTMDPQYTGQSAGILNSSYAAYQLWIYPQATGNGTWSSCYQTFNVKFRFGIPSLGYFPDYETKLAR